MTLPISVQQVAGPLQENYAEVIRERQVTIAEIDGDVVGFAGAGDLTAGEPPA